MMNVQARMLVPAWKRCRAAQAFISVSCTRSSARSRLPDSERPKARRCGITWASCCLNSGSDKATCSGGAGAAASWSMVSVMRLHSLTAYRGRSFLTWSARQGRASSVEKPDGEEDDDHQHQRCAQYVTRYMRGCAGTGLLPTEVSVFIWV